MASCLEYHAAVSDETTSETRSRRVISSLRGSSQMCRIRHVFRPRSSSRFCALARNLRIALQLTEWALEIAGKSHVDGEDGEERI